MCLQWADHRALKVSFDCATCKDSVKKLRRCGEDRMDFDFRKGDDNIWPMAVEPGGPMFGFCPGKATWDREAVGIYHLLVISSETGQLYNAGGLADQPAWYVDLLSWFVPRYNDHRFYSRVKSVLGSGDNAKTANLHKVQGGPRRS